MPPRPAPIQLTSDDPGADGWSSLDHRLSLRALGCNGACLDEIELAGAEHGDRFHAAETISFRDPQRGKPGPFQMADHLSWRYRIARVNHGEPFAAPFIGNAGNNAARSE